MGINASIYRSGTYDCTNGGVSSKTDRVCIVNADGPFHPDENTPPMMLIKHRPFGESRKMVIAVPARMVAGKWEPLNNGIRMFGGNYVACSDSRFSQLIGTLIDGETFYGAVAIHDRFE